jgi:DNA-binding transcriptional ArsR family regulator
MLEVEVINDPVVAMVALDPVRSRLLAELAEPASAATLATRLGIARQKVNYHLRALESHGLAKVAEQRQWGGLTERLLVATATSYVVSPSALGPVAAALTPEKVVEEQIFRMLTVPREPDSARLAGQPNVLRRRKRINPRSVQPTNL